MLDPFLNLMAAGLAFDGFGVLVLAYAFFVRSIDSLATESGTYYGGNNALLSSLIQARTDGIVGTLLLVIGFVLQWLAAVGISEPKVAGILYVLLAVLLAGYLGAIRRILVSRQFRRALRLRDADEEHSGQ